VEVDGVLRVFGELGMMPRPAFGGALAVRIQRGSASGEASAVVLLPTTGTLPNDASRGGRFSWFGGQLSGCLSTGAGNRLEGCAGGEVGRLSGTGVGVDVQETRHAAWLGPLFGVRAALPVTRDATFEAQLSLVVPLLRPTFALEQLGEVHTPGVLSGRLGLGIRWP
jgi:hypothetical protein